MVRQADVEMTIGKEEVYTHSSRSRMHPTGHRKAPGWPGVRGSRAKRRHQLFLWFP